jgi:hypothetical protein
MNSMLRSWHEKGYLNYSLIPFVAFGLIIAHQIYLNIPHKNESPPFAIGGVSEGSVGDLSVVFSVENEEGKVGEEFLLEFTLTNHGEADYVRRIGLPFFDVRIHDENGNQIARWSDGRQLCRNLFLIIVKSGDDFTEAKVWDLTVYNQEGGEPAPLEVGRYWLSGVWLCGPIIETGKIPLVIGELGP